MNTSHQTRFRDNSFNIGADTSTYGSKLQSINATEKRSKRPNIITSNSPMFQTINMNRPAPNAPFMPSRPASLPLTTPNRTFVQAPALKSTQKQQRKYRQLAQLKSKLKEEKAQLINKINHMQLRANVALQASKEIQTTFGEPAPKIVIPTLATADPDQLTENLQHNNSRIGTSTGSFGLPLQPQTLNLDKLYIQNQALNHDQAILMTKHTVFKKRNVRNDMLASRTITLGPGSVELQSPVMTANSPAGSVQSPERIIMP